MTLERPRRSKLAQLVADHVFGHGDLHVLAAIVDHERHVHELRNDGAGASPRLDRFASPFLSLLLHFEEQLRIDKRAFLATTAQGFSIDG